MALDTSFQIPTSTGPLEVPIKSGHVVLFVGPNGVGKSALIHQIPRSLPFELTELFPGHRQIHFQSDDVETVGQPLNTVAKNRFNHFDNTNRFKDTWSEVHLKSVLKRLVDHENQVNHDATSTIRSLKVSSKQELNDDSKLLITHALETIENNPSLIDTLNSVFKISRLEVEIILEDGLLRASRNGKIYGIDRLSDGERAALLLTSAILVRPENGIILIDEPEKHLNPAIFGALIAAAVRSRPDVGFILASHDLSLIDWLTPNVVITVKSSTVVRDRPEERIYEVYRIDSNDGVSEEVKRSILGVRKSILFVEGQSGSDDPLLYSSLFKQRSVVAKGGWDSVVNSVKVLKKNASYHWLNVDGLIDKDGRTDAEIAAFSLEGIFCLGVPTIENLYFLKPVVQAMSEVIRKAKGGKTAEERVDAAQLCLPELFQTHRQNIIYRQVVWIVNRMLSERKVSVGTLSSGQQIIDPIHIATHLTAQSAAYDQATQVSRIETLENIPIKNTSIPAKLAEAIGYESFKDYKTAVLHQIDLESDQGDIIISSMKAKIPSAFDIPA